MKMQILPADPMSKARISKHAAGFWTVLVPSHREYSVITGLQFVFKAVSTHKTKAQARKALAALLAEVA